MAQQEGLLDINDPVSDYLGEGWTFCTPEQEAEITVWHQLTMTSGLNELVDDWYCTEPQCLEYLALPGERWAYHNGPYTLLTEVVEAASGQTFNQFVGDRISAPTGMSGFYFPVGYNRIHISTIRDMARFGLLMQAGGSWNGEAVMTDEVFFNALTTPSQEINESYGYLWWLNGQSSFMLPGVQFAFPGMLVPAAPADMVAAIGKDSQIINLVPSQDLLVLRMGNTPDDALVGTDFNTELWEVLNLVLCNETAIEENEKESLEVYPNPADQQVTISGAGVATQWVLYTASGTHVASGRGAVVHTALYLQACMCSKQVHKGCA